MTKKSVHFLLLLVVLTAFGCAAAIAADVYPQNTGPSNTSGYAVPQATPLKAQTSPAALVADLYKQHDAKKSPFFQTKNRGLLDKYFTKSTADLIWNDAISSKGEVGALDGDPLYNAQDIQIKKFAVGAEDIKGSAAAVPVTFENLGKKQKFTFDLVMENGAWKIQDIKYDDGSTLLGFFK
jgi:Protein of unknown function (DUF3828)